MRFRRPLTAAGAVLASCGLVLGTGTPALAAPHWERKAMHIPQAHRISTGKGTTVAVLDTGVDASHPDLKGKVTSGPDFIKSGAKRGDADWGDHGTAMASDVLTVAPDAHILSVRVIMDKSDPVFKKKNGKGTRDDELAIQDGIKYAVDHGADVISLSLGEDEWALFGGYNALVANTIRYANEHGVAVVASAGNGGDRSDVDSTNKNSYPAAYSGVIAVAALGPHFTRAKFSQVHSYVSVTAPGVDIYSAKHYGGHQLVSGTSPAGALVAGAAALIRGKYPKLSPWQVRQAMATSAFRAKSGHWNPLLGWGLVNAEAALKAAAKMTPQPAGAQPVAYKGKKYFGKGPDDTKQELHPPMNPIGLSVGIGGTVLGLALIGGAVVLIVVGRRRRRAA